jgi:ABC-type dipeptide/oligopeptide/nickel transport system permease subunit
VDARLVGRVAADAKLSFLDFEIQVSFPTWGNLYFSNAALYAKQSMIAIDAGPADPHRFPGFSHIGDGYGGYFLCF